MNSRSSHLLCDKAEKPVLFSVITPLQFSSHMFRKKQRASETPSSEALKAVKKYYTPGIYKLVIGGDEKAVLPTR